MGHGGRGKAKEVPVFIAADNMSEAMAKAMQLPAIKHDHLPLSAKEITKEEFDQGRQENVYIRMIESRLKGKSYEKSCNLY